MEIMTEEEKKLFSQYCMRKNSMCRVGQRRVKPTEAMMAAMRKHHRIQYWLKKEELAKKVVEVSEMKRPKRKQWPWESE